MKRLGGVKPISFAQVGEAIVNKKRQLTGYIAPSYNEEPYEDFVTSPDAAKRHRTAAPTAAAAFTHLHEVAGKLREQAGAASGHLTAGATVLAANAVAAQQHGREQLASAGTAAAAAAAAARHKLAASTAHAAQAAQAASSHAYGTAQAASSAAQAATSQAYGTAQAAASTAMRMADDEVDALVDPLAQVGAAPVC